MPMKNIQHTLRTVFLATTIFVIAGCEKQSTTSVPVTTSVAQRHFDDDQAANDFVIEVPVTTSVAQRHFWVTGLDPEKAEYYEALHADPWPSVTKTIRQCNIQNMSIHKREIDGKLYLFLYLEYVGDDFDADMAKMAADPETQRWWKETDPCQLPLPDAFANGGQWSETEDVFHQQ